jgi:ferredoxin-NADP reductase
LNDKKPDRRGNRRYFTIASAPSERDVRLGVKFYENSSTFKKNLFALKAGDHVMAGQLAGDFTLPEDPSKKLVFIAGGIGITPFRSMIKHLLDNNQKRDIVVFYSIRIASERAYGDILQLAQQELGIKVIESVTEISGRLTAEQIQSQVSDYKDRIFYLSGPQGMVKGFESSLQTLGVPHLQIKKDFFPGYV